MDERTKQYQEKHQSLLEQFNKALESSGDVFELCFLPDFTERMRQGTIREVRIR